MYNTILHEVFETLIIVQTRSFYPHHRISYTNTLIFLYNEFVFVFIFLKIKKLTVTFNFTCESNPFSKSLIADFFSQALEDKSTIYTHASLYSCQPILN